MFEIVRNTFIGGDILVVVLFDSLHVNSVNGRARLVDAEGPVC